MSKLISHLVATSSGSTRKQCYSNLFQLLKSDKKDEIYELCDALPKLIPVLLVDIRAASSEELSQAALRACGTLLHNSAVASALSALQVRDIIKTLCETIQNTTQKNDCILATWCLSVMGVAPGGASIEVSVVLQALLYALTATTFHSPSLEQEAIGAIAKLLTLRPDDMAAQMLLWAPLIYVRLLSPIARVRDKAEAILAGHTSMLCSVASQLPKKVYDDLRGGLLTEMTDQLNASGKETIVMRAWGWLAQLAGPMLWHKTLINSMLKVPEVTFASARPEVRLETHVAWRRFVLNFRAQLLGTSPPGLNKKLTLLLLPINACLKSEGEEQVRQACLQTWLQLVAAITVLPANTQGEFATDLLETPLEFLLKDSSNQPSSVLRIAASEVLEVVAGNAPAASAGGANAAQSDDAPSRAEAIEVREIRHLTPLSQPAVLRLLRVALEQPNPIYDRLERVWRRLIASCSPGAEAHDPAPFVPIVKFAASAAEPSDASEAKKDWLGRSLYAPLVARLQELHLIHVSPSPPLPDDRTLIGHLLYSWLAAPAASPAARAKQLDHLEPLLATGHGLDALSFTATVVRELNGLVSQHPPGFVLGAASQLARALHRHLEIALRISPRGAASQERDLSTIYDVLRLPLVLALRPELDKPDTTTVADARTTWAELFGTLHRHALLGGTEKAVQVVEDLGQRLPLLPLPTNTAAQGVPMWWLLAADAWRLTLENFSWTKAHRTTSPRKGASPGEEMLRVAGEATELAAGLLPAQPADAARLLTPVNGIIQALPSSYFAVLRTNFLPHWSRAVPLLLASPAYSAISGPFGGVWAAVYDRLKVAPSSALDSALLNNFAVILREGFISPERAIRSPTIEAWNASFGQRASRELTWPAELLPLLPMLRSKQNILLPKHILPPGAPPVDEIVPPTPDEEMHDDIVPLVAATALRGAKGLKDNDKGRREEEKNEDKRPRRETRADAAAAKSGKGGQSAYVPVPPPPASETPKTEKQKEAGKRKADVALYSKLDPSSIDATQEAAELDPRKHLQQHAAQSEAKAVQVTTQQPAQNPSAVETPVRAAASGGLDESPVQQLARIAELPAQKLEAESPEALHAMLRHALSIASRVAPLIKPPRLSVVSQYY